MGYYLVTSRGVIPICCLKRREKYWGDWNPQAKQTSLMDISKQFAQITLSHVGIRGNVTSRDIHLVIQADV